MVANIVTARLLQLIDEGETGRTALHTIAAELKQPVDRVVEQGASTLEELRECDIIVAVA